MKRLCFLFTSTAIAGACDHPAAAGDRLSMNYIGTIDKSSTAGEGGAKFDSSYDRNEPFDFTLGKGEVIKGWDEGLIGVCPGDKKTLVIPPEDGYGDQGAGSDIPGGATLNFEVSVEAVNDDRVMALNGDADPSSDAMLRGNN